MTSILIIGIIAIVFGILFIFKPKLLEKLNEFGNRIITTDEFAIIYRHISGVLLIIIGIILFIIAFSEI